VGHLAVGHVAIRIEDVCKDGNVGAIADEALDDVP